MSDEQDIGFLRQAIEKSRQSLKEGNFPAGAVVVKDGKIIATAVSSPYPGLFHADSKAPTEAFGNYGVLKGASLYVGLESCMMCLGVAYWAGIRDIYYAVPKSKVSKDYYDIPKDVSHLAAELNEPIALHHVPELEAEALAVIREWEKKHGNTD
jgi:tRNA(Arg) A34 adenosine deaminase TadA